MVCAWKGSCGILWCHKGSRISEVSVPTTCTSHYKISHVVVVIVFLCSSKQAEGASKHQVLGRSYNSATGSKQKAKYWVSLSSFIVFCFFMTHHTRLLCWSSGRNLRMWKWKSEKYWTCDAGGCTSCIWALRPTVRKDSEAARQIKGPLSDSPSVPPVKSINARNPDNGEHTLHCWTN